MIDPPDWGDEILEDDFDWPPERVFAGYDGDVADALTHMLLDGEEPGAPAGGGSG